MVSIGEVAQTILKHTDCGKPIETDEIRMRPPGSEVMALMADASAFTAATGWTPETKLETGLGLTIDWWRAHMANVRADTGYAI
jgi:nucleoside-diphosphate-sugar epimerase